MVFILAFDKCVSSRNVLLGHFIKGESRNWHQWSTWIEGNKTSMRSVLAKSKRLTIYFHIVKSYSKHILEQDIIPMNISLVFSSIYVTKRQIRFNPILFLIFETSQIKWKNITFKKMLLDHFIENWSDTSFSQCWIGKTNDCFEVWSRKYCVLTFNISKFLILNMDLTTGCSSFAGTQSDVISHKMPC